MVLVYTDGRTVYKSYEIKQLTLTRTIDNFNGFYIYQIDSEDVIVLSVETSAGYIIVPVYMTNQKLRLEVGSSTDFPLLPKDTEITFTMTYIEL